MPAEIQELNFGATAVGTALLREIKEKSTAIFKAQLIDDAGAKVAQGDIASLVCDLYYRDSLGGLNYINSRQAQDVRGGGTGSNNFVIATDGTITWNVQPADNVIVKPTNRVERHHLILKAMTTVASLTLHFERTLDILNLTTEA